MIDLTEAASEPIVPDDSDTLQDHVGGQLERAVAELGLDRAALEVYRALTAESLAGIDGHGPLPRFSTINNDGLPFQYVVSMGGQEPGLAYLTEVGIPGSSVPARIDLTRARLGDVMPRIGLAGAMVELDHALRVVLPGSTEELAPWRGGIWVAVGCGRDGVGLKVYVNGRRPVADDAWQAVFELLRSAGRHRADVRLADLVARIDGVAIPAGVAIALTPAGLGTLKVYARLDQWRSDLLGDVLRQTGHGDAVSALTQFGQSVRATGMGRPGSVVLSLEFPVDDGDIDVKLDVCAHCRFKDDVSARAATLDLAAMFDLPTEPYERVLSAIKDDPSASLLRHHAFLGLGLSHREPIRLNAYLKPVLATAPARRRTSASTAPWRSVGSSQRQRLETGLADGLAFILGSQSPSGAWLDFALPPGPSDAWVTAYVGLALTEALRDGEATTIRTAVDRALAWSASAMRPDHRWGYNAFTESDADTSAWTILFLRANGWQVPSRCASALAGFQQPDGGYATFRGLPVGDSWLDSHPDVTPIAVRAQRELGAFDVAEGSRRSIADAQTGEGSWNSFWWTTPWYATWANLSLVEPAGWAYDRDRAATWVSEASVDDAAFETALALRSCVLLRDTTRVGRSRIRALVEALCLSQEADGSWASTPMLRLTAARAHDPWTELDSGRAYADPRRIFTTATVVAALREARDTATTSTP